MFPKRHSSSPINSPTPCKTTLRERNPDRPGPRSEGMTASQQIIATTLVERETSAHELPETANLLRTVAALDEDSTPMDRALRRDLLTAARQLDLLAASCEAVESTARRSAQSNRDVTLLEPL